MIAYLLDGADTGGKVEGKLVAVFFQLVLQFLFLVKELVLALGVWREAAPLLTHELNEILVALMLEVRF